MKLSKTQEQTLKWAKESIDEARTLSFEEWHEAHFRCTLEAQRKYNPEGFEDYLADCIARYEERKSGITQTHCNGQTLYKLQKLGLIEIVADTTNTGYSIDKVKVLNY